VLPVRLDEAEEATRIVLGGYGLSARDALHVATMRSNGTRRILSFDTSFDDAPGIDRLG
jgi:predicted nucleic acid-binding protein